jgi:poly-gamma-glutamate synthesis protein (capsule biosynthesis protein)
VKKQSKIGLTGWIVALLLLTHSVARADENFTATRPASDRTSAELRRTLLSGCEPSLFLAGDAIIMRRWSHVQDPLFRKLIAEIRAADVAIANLETLIHEYKGYAQAHSGGSYMASRPEIASELAWAGVDMLSSANNHTFDYGSTGVLENIENVSKAGIVLAGSGEDLQNARAPRYYTYPGGKLGLVSMASTFVSYGKASRSRPDMRGRPGLNPLTLTSRTEITIPRSHARAMRRLVSLLGFNAARFSREEFRLAGRRFRLGQSYSLARGLRPAPKDLAGNLDAIGEAADVADIVVVSIHAHRQGEWLEKFARQAVERGADIFLAHGPHRILGVEIHDGKPIFYGMGNFLFERDHIEQLPSEYYERYGLGDDATVSDAIEARAAETRAAPEDHESFATSVCFRSGKVAEIRLLPMDLDFQKPATSRGRPHYADLALGRSIIDAVNRASEAHGTRIEYDERNNVGNVAVD